MTKKVQLDSKDQITLISSFLLSMTKNILFVKREQDTQLNLN